MNVRDENDGRFPTPVHADDAGLGALGPDYLALRIEAAREVVRMGRISLDDRFPHARGKNSFDAIEWATGNPRAPTLYFAWDHRPAGREPRCGYKDVPWPAHLGDLVKAYVALRSDLDPVSVAKLLVGLRYFLRFLRQCPRWRADWGWWDLRDDDLAGFESWIKRVVGAKGLPLGLESQWSSVTEATAFGRWLHANDICDEIAYATSLENPSNVGARTRAEGEMRAERLLPQLAVMEELLTLYFRMTEGDLKDHPDVGDLELLLISLAVVQMCTGIRVGELLSLLEKCERWRRFRPITESRALGTGPLLKQCPEDVDSGALRVRYAIVYYVEKAGERRLIPSWVSETAAPLVADCIARIRRITNAARVRARVLADPNLNGEIPLPPNVAGRPWISTRETAELFGYKERLRTRGNSPGKYIRKRTKYRVPVSEVAHALRMFAATIQPIRVFPDGTRVEFQDALLTCFEGLTSGRRAGNNELLVTAVREHSYRLFLTGATNLNIKSVFERFSDQENVPDKAVRTHAFRRLWTNEGRKAMLPDHVIARLFGRADARHNKAYMSPELDPVPSDLANASDEEIAEHVRSLIRQGKGVAAFSLAYFSIEDEAEREEFLRAHVRVGHFVGHGGYCKRDYTVNPCDKHLNCIGTACRDYVGTKGDPDEIAAVQLQLDRTDGLVRLGRAAADAGEEWGRPYADHHEKQALNLRTILAMHADPAIPVGSLIRVFHQNEPVALERAQARLT